MKNVFFLPLLLLCSLQLTAQSEDIRVFPNPVVESFEIGHSERIASIRVVNMVGREVRAFDYAPQSAYAIGDLPQGMYLIQLRDREERVIHTQRVKKG